MKSKQQIKAAHDTLCELLNSRVKIDDRIDEQLVQMMAMCCWVLGCDDRNAKVIDERLAFCREVLEHMKTCHEDIKVTTE